MIWWKTLRSVGWTLLGLNAALAAWIIPWEWSARVQLFCCKRLYRCAPTPEVRRHALKGIWRFEEILHRVP